MEISQIQVSFSAGEANVMNWQTDDCVSGTLLDAYNGKNPYLHSVGISPLIVVLKNYYFQEIR